MHNSNNTVYYYYNYIYINLDIQLINYKYCKYNYSCIIID